MKFLFLPRACCSAPCSPLGIENFAIKETFSAAVLEGLKCRHPLYDRESLLILGAHVTLEAGTGCVHTAPGHGQEDYESGLEIRS